MCCYTYLISCLSLWLESSEYLGCVLLYIPDLMFVIVAGMSKVPGLCIIHTWSHVCHRGWNVQSSRIVCYTYLISCLSSWLECCYTYLISCLSLWLECPKFQDCVLYIPDLMFVIVAGMSKVPGLCVVIPTSIDPDHLSTKTSKRIWNNIVYICWRHSDCKIINIPEDLSFCWICYMKINFWKLTS